MTSGLATYIAPPPPPDWAAAAGLSASAQAAERGYGASSGNPAVSQNSSASLRLAYGVS